MRRFLTSLCGLILFTCAITFSPRIERSHSEGQKVSRMVFASSAYAEDSVEVGPITVTDEHQTEVDQVKPATDAIAEIIVFLKNIPIVGKYIQTVLEILILVAGIANILYGTLKGLAMLGTKYGGAKLAAWTENVWEKIKPVVDFIGRLSNFNIKKK